MLNFWFGFLFGWICLLFNKWSQWSSFVNSLSERRMNDDFRIVKLFRKLCSSFCSAFQLKPSATIPLNWFVAFIWIKKNTEKKACLSLLS